MARAGLGLTLDDLATLSDVRKMTISKFERGGNVLPSIVETLRMHLVAHGAEFINGGQSIGVRVPRYVSEEDEGRQLREAVAAHSKVVRLIKRKGR
jgi:transcriptional regulator with XRE-family HTH domain